MKLTKGYNWAVLLFGLVCVAYGMVLGVFLHLSLEAEPEHRGQWRLAFYVWLALLALMLLFPAKTTDSWITP